MALGAMWYIRKDFSFSLDWKLLLKNVLLIGIFCVGMLCLKQYVDWGVL